MTSYLAEPIPAPPPVVPGGLSTVTSRGRVVAGDTWPGTRALTASPLATRAGLNLDECLGQRVATWTFQLIDGITGQVLGELTPVKQPAVISHDTSRTIKRDLRVGLTQVDVAAINPLRDRVLPYMHIAGYAYPLGRFMVTDPTTLVSTGGDRGIYTLLDEMFRIDQQLERGFSSTDSVDQAVLELLDGIDLVGTTIAATTYPAVGGWAAGTMRGQVLDSLASQGDYETAWMNNQGLFAMVRTVDPDNTVADLDFDTGRRVISESPSQTSDQIYAPNRFIVIANSGGAVDGAVIGQYDVPAAAAHSISNRGYIVPAVFPIQVANQPQAAAVARGIGLRQTVFLRQDLETVPDPRHDSYQVIHWQDHNWLELGWSMICDDGAPMRHSLRRALI